MPGEPQAAVHQPGKVRRWFSAMKFYLLSWLSVTGLTATTSVCPLCGQAGCPVGLGQAAGLGLIATLVLGVLVKVGLAKPKTPDAAPHDHRHPPHV